VIRGEALEGWLQRALPAASTASSATTASTRPAALPPLAWIAGDEPLLMQEAADAWRAACRRLGHSERITFVAERGFRIEAIEQEAATMSLFAGQRLLELRVAGKPGKELGEALAELAARLPDDVRLLVTSGRLDRATTESAWFARIDKVGLAVVVNGVERARVPQWLAERLARNGQRADPQTLSLLAERVEGNLLAAHQEVLKLALLLPPGQLDADAVRAAVMDVARYDVFALVDASVAGDASRAVRTLQGLKAEGTAAPMVLWALADAVRTLLRLSLVRSAGRPLGPAMRELRVWGERERLYARALERLSPTLLRQCLREAARTDRMIKGLLRQDAWLALESVVLALAGVSTPPLAQAQARR
jgi:DNA polymerase III subunit delta